MLDFQIPRITTETVEDNRGSFAIEPLDRGFGYTFGNSLRRVLLSSLAGAAVTSVRIEGVAHEFSTIKGVTEDVTDIVLNLKGIVCRMHSDATEVEAPLVVTGPGEITAKDIDLPAGVEILNPDVHIATLEKKTKLELYLTIGRGRGYRPAEDNKSARPADRRHPDRLDLLAGPARRLRGRAGPRRSAHRLRQAHARHRDRRVDRPAGRAARGGRDPDLAAGDLHRRRPHRGAPRRPGRRARAGRPRARCNGAGAAAGGPDARHPHRGARARRPVLQLPQARRHPDGRRPDLEVRGRAQRDPELRQEVDRRGHRDPRTRAVWTSARTKDRDACATRRPATSSAATRRTARRCCANLCKEVIEHERIKTTEAKAKAVKPEVEKLITLAKRGDLHARRQALSALGQDKFTVHKLFEEVAPRYAERPGGYTRILKLGPRRSDATEMVFLELV